jgi:hypothetical protein
MEPFFAAHASLRTDPAARTPANTRVVDKSAHRWNLVQVLCDAEDDNDWAIQGYVDLVRSRAEGRPVFVLERIGT